MALCLDCWQIYQISFQYGQTGRVVWEDMTLFSRRSREENGNSYIMEFKVFDRERDENMKACVARALQQIEEKQYETELVADGIARERIRKYGFAFDGKKVLIGS